MKPILILILQTLILLASAENECTSVDPICVDLNSYKMCIADINGGYKAFGDPILCLDGTFCSSGDCTVNTQCVSTSPICKNLNTLQNCSVTSNGTYEAVGEPQQCPSGNICFDGSCMSTNLLAATPQCSAALNYSADLCHQYYECVQFLFWWNPELKTCPYGQNFDTDTRKCLPSDSVDCQTRISTTTTTTTVGPPIVPPYCTSASKHPALLCYQYYECVPKLWWFETYLRTCPNGQAFDASKGECVCAGLLNCQVPPATETKCDSSGTLASTSCKQYYECTKKFWWWEPVLKDCPSGQSYDIGTCQCVEDGSVTCSTSEPECYGWARYPAAQENQYYECVINDSGTDWVPELKTCWVGYVFSAKSGGCIKA